MAGKLSPTWILKYLLYFLLLVLRHYVAPQGRNLTLGLLLPDVTSWSLGAQRSAAYIAADDINKKEPLMDGSKLNIIFRDSDCSPVVSSGATADLFYKNNVDAFIGPHCSDSCAPSGFLAAYFKRPMISHACSASKLSNKKVYSTFARTKVYGRTDVKNLIDKLNKVMDLFNWQYLTIITSRKLSMQESAQYMYRNLGSYSTADGKKKKKAMNVHQFSEKDGGLIDVKEQLRLCKDGARVILLLAHYTQVAQIIVQARELGMMDGEIDGDPDKRYVFLTTDFVIEEEEWRDSSWINDSVLFKRKGGAFPDPDKKDPDKKWLAIFSGLIDFRMQTVAKKKLAKFNKEVVKGLNNPLIPNYKRVISQQYKDQAGTEAVNLYDAVKLYAVAYNKTYAECKKRAQGKKVDQSCVTDIDVMMSNILGQTFQGKFGPITITKKGDRKPDTYNLVNFKKKREKITDQNGKITGSREVYDFVDICNLDLDSKTNNLNSCNELKKDGKLSDPDGKEGEKGIRWPCFKNPSACYKVPPDQPRCWFKGDNPECKGGNKQDVVVILVILFVVLFVAMILVFILFKKRKFERDLLGEGFFIKYQDIENSCINGQNGRAGGGSISSRVAVITTGLMFPESISVQSNDTMDKNQFIYNGQTVIKKTLDKANANITREMLLEFKMVRELHNINLCTVVGVCIQSPSLCILMSYCSKGSLQDVLQNADIRLDTMFQTSFSSDVAAGMTELHRNGIIHGRLHSENCVIDNRWVCKVTDFGMDKFKQAHSNNNNDEEENYSRYKKMFWRAPELLDKESSKKTKEGDTYSYGIIISEILSREDPYAETGLDAKDIIQLVNKRDDPPFRPQVKEDNYDKRIVALMKQCWSDSPFERPDFNTIKNKWKRISGKQGNLVDNMIDMMEKYTNNLEDLVDQRTEELAAEKLKTDDLLYKMLPKAITEQLKNGMQVEAETFECVTIFFSDIVGFTSLAAQSTPMQVVALLNDLYTCFDTCSDQYDVYKVETIGDAYMVVSGLPERNGNRHAGEIATLSLDLLHNIRTFRIRHLPDKHMQLRIGIHSGPCVAGVVGLKMPRYCLFGDTVNYASRMESSGLALRVHVSPECKEILDELKLYKLEDRGLVKMKGKGEIHTYFLVGKEGFDKELPDLGNAASLADHEFK